MRKSHSHCLVPPLCPAPPTTWCDPHHDLGPPSGSTHQRSAVQLQRLPTTTQLPHPWGSHQPQRSAAAAGGGWRAGGGGRGGHREHRYRADSRGQQRHREQEAELRRARRDIQQRAGQRGASCCQSGVWGGTHDLLRPNRGIVGYWVRGLTESARVSWEAVVLCVMTCWLRNGPESAEWMKLYVCIV